MVQTLPLQTPWCGSEIGVVAAVSETKASSPRTAGRGILRLLPDGAPTTPCRHSRHSRQGVAGWIVALALVATAGCGGGKTLVRNEGAIAASEARATTFPRSTALFLAQDHLPGAATLAKSDVVVIDSEWAHRLPASFFAEIRRLNPRVRLLAYVNVVDRPRSIGSRDYYANRYDLWQFDGRQRSKLPLGWLARTASGQLVSEFPDTDMTNMTGVVKGRRFADYAVDWMVRKVWASGVWDGLFLDVWGDLVYDVSQDSWDANGDGRDESNRSIFGRGKAWERAVSAAEASLRRRIPKALLVANGTRTLAENRLDGRVWESFADPLRGRDASFDLRDYVTLASTPGHRLPGLMMTINRLPQAGSLDGVDYRRARSFLTGTLLQNGYWASTGVNYDRLVAYDEMDGGGRGRGYLGKSLVPSPTWSQVSGKFRKGIGDLGGKVYRRDFANGIVMHNAGTDPVTVKLERHYWHIKGTQDPVINDGAKVTEVTIASDDGLILVRKPTP